jgi:hypothetical protein
MYRSTAGPAYDLEKFSFERQAYVALPNILPDSGVQGMQLLDFQNRHTEAAQVSQMSGYHSSNPLPYERFVGPYARHVNEPLPLSVNECMYE